ncbi:hypothetical protein, partial [Paenibacillus thiaminolyticus]
KRSECQVLIMSMDISTPSKIQRFSNGLTFAGLSSNSGLKRRNAVSTQHFKGSSTFQTVYVPPFFPHPHSLLSRHLNHFPRLIRLSCPKSTVHNLMEAQP